MSLIKIHDHSPAYLGYWQSSEVVSSEPADEIRWVREVESATPFIYSIVKEYGYASRPLPLQISLDQLQPILSKATEVSVDQVSRLEQLLGSSEEVADFHLVPLNRTAPCLTGCFTNIQQRPMSIVGFDGFLDRLDYFGIVCAHEMTHALHMHFNHPGPIETQSGTFAQCLWNEGLAEFTSAFLNPEFPKEKMLRGSLQHYTFDRIRPLVKRFGHLLDVPLNEESASLHRMWFGMGGRDGELEIPPAAAYIMGYRLIEYFAGKDSIEKLIRMPRSIYTEKLRELSH